MLDYRGHYEFGFFASGAGLEPTSENIFLLMELFKDKGFIPTTIQELQIGPDARNRMQLQLTEKQLEWNLAFEPHRVLLSKRNIHGEDIGTPDNFMKEAVDVFSKLLTGIPLVGNRLSYVTRGLLKEMKTEDLEQVNSKLIKAPSFYMKNHPCEWSMQNLARIDISIGGKIETINVITQINRIQGLLNISKISKPFDRIEVVFDINTYQKNMSSRFNFNDVNNFLEEAIKVSAQILNEMGDIIYA